MTNTSVRCALLAAIVVGLLAGCGPTLRATMDQLKRESDSTPPGAPVVIVGAIARTTGSVTVPYVIADAESNAVDITVMYSTDGGTTYAAATAGAGGDGVSALTSAPGAGAAHTYVWDAPADIGVSYRASVLLQIAAADNSTSPTVADSAAFAFGNDVPGVGIATPAGTGSGGVVVALTLTDSSADPLNLTIEVSLDDGVTYSPATIGLGATVGAPSSPTGVQHLLVWDSATDTGESIQSTVKLRATAQDTLAGVSTPIETGTFAVNNNTPPVVAITPPTSPISGNPAIAYTLSDTNSDNCSIVPQFSTDGGLIYQAAGEADSLISDGVTNLGSSPGGTSHSFVWDAIEDLGQGTHAGVLFRLTPFDIAAGIPVSTAAFTVEISTLPVVTGAVYADPGFDGVSAGDTITVTFSEAVTLTSPVPSDFDLPVAGDTFGSGATVGAGASATKVVITLGIGASLTLPDAFSGGAVTVGNPSGIDVSATMTAGAIRSAATLSDAAPLAPVDIEAPLFAIHALFSDLGAPGASSGDEIVVTFNQPVIVNGATLGAFAMPVVGDSPGSGASVSAGPAADQVTITLGSSPVLKSSGVFDTARTTSGSPSGIDIAASIGTGKIVSLTGVTASDRGVAGLDDDGVDLALTTVNPQLIDILWQDCDTSGTVTAGDVVALRFDKIVDASALAIADILLPVVSDTLGTGSRLAAPPDAGDAYVIVGASPVLTIPGVFSGASTSPGSPSGITIGAAGASKIVGRFGHTATVPGAPIDAHTLGVTVVVDFNSTAYRDATATTGAWRGDGGARLGGASYDVELAANRVAGGAWFSGPKLDYDDTDGTASVTIGSTGIRVTEVQIAIDDAGLAVELSLSDGDDGVVLSSKTVTDEPILAISGGVEVFSFPIAYDVRSDKSLTLTLHDVDAVGKKDVIGSAVSAIDFRAIGIAGTFDTSSDIISDKVNPGTGVIKSATLTPTIALNGGTALFYMSVDGGLTWESVTAGVLHVFATPGNDLRFKVSLGTTDTSSSPEIDSIDVTWTDSLPPLLRDVTYGDEDVSSTVNVGDTLTLAFTVDVDATGATLADFVLAVADDSFGAGASVAPGVAANEVVITLGTAPVVTIVGAFDPAVTTAGSPSGIAVAVPLSSPDAIEDGDGNDASGTDPPVDIE